jgi:hypothetical protein
MILSKEIKTTISHFNINHYTSIGYDNIKCNQSIIVPIEHLPKESNLKILVKCDICNQEKIIFYQKYNKNISKYGIYTCSTICAQFKIKKTNLERYGNKNYVNTKLLKETIRDKYDIITNEVKERGYINCIKCNLDNSLDEFLVKNGRYKHICRLCRNSLHYSRLNKNPHVKAWRNILKGYLLRKNIKKNDKTLNLLKYSTEEIKNHLSNLFVDDMNWDNYGTNWHIDHIIHLSYFKDDTPCEIVNSLENLRPYNKRMNISRHNNMDNDCIELLSKYKTYIKEEYIK